jgi:hypothetical protein
MSGLADYDYRARAAFHPGCDVLVVGGGSAGCAAAFAAAKNGSRVVLVERYGFLGGTGTAILDTFYGFFTPGTKEQKVVGGVPDLVIERLSATGSVFKRPNTYGAGAGWTYDPERLKVVWDELLAEAGVEVLLHVHFVDAILEDKRIVGAVVATRDGLRAIRARTVVDASGDAEVVARAGGTFENAGVLGDAQSLTTTFKMINVDVTRATQVPKKELWALMSAAGTEGYALPRREGSAHVSPLSHVMVTNMTRITGTDATDPLSLSKAEAEGRRQAFEYARFLHDKVPGYERAQIGGLSVQIGIRETRRVCGDYRLTRDDVLGAAKFDDAIARCGAPLEDHHSGADTRWEYLPDGETYQIPFRALLPAGLDGIIVAGRCLSASHDAHASVRSIGQCLAMGQAAGIAATLAADGDLRQVNTAVLRGRLLEIGALL